jgi:hypothetical protein
VPTALSADTGSPDLTIANAASAFAGMLSSEEEHATPAETPPTQESPESAPVEETPEATEQTEDSEGDPQTEESTEAQPEQPAMVTIKIDGVDTQVTLEEALKGYSRTADYTRKTQELADKRKAFEAEDTAVRAERQQYATQLKMLEQQIAESTPQEPDWDKLYETQPPEEVNALWVRWDRHKKYVADVAEKRQKAEEAMFADYKRQYDADVAAEQEKLLAVLPEWKDPAVASKGRAQLAAYAKEEGYSAKDLEGITDHRIIKILRKAMLYDEAQKKKPAIQQTISKVKAATPGASTPPGKTVDAHTKARQRLAQTGKVADAAAVFLDFIPESK